MGRAKKTLIPIKKRLGEKQGEKGSQHKEGAKGNVVITLDDPQGNQADADDRTSERADHDGEERRLPAKKRTDHRQQLDIATSHPLLAEEIGTQPGQKPEDAASHGETEHRIDYTYWQNGHCAQKSDHHSRQSNDIGDHLMGEIRSRYHDQRRKQQGIEDCRPAWTEIPQDYEIAEGVGSFDEGIT